MLFFVVSLHFASYITFVFCTYYTFFFVLHFRYHRLYALNLDRASFNIEKLNTSPLTLVLLYRLQWRETKWLRGLSVAKVQARHGCWIGVRLHKPSCSAGAELSACTCLLVLPQFH